MQIPREIEQVGMGDEARDPPLPIAQGLLVEAQRQRQDLDHEEGEQARPGEVGQTSLDLDIRPIKWHGGRQVRIVFRSRNEEEAARAGAVLAANARPAWTANRNATRRLQPPYFRGRRPVTMSKPPLRTSRALTIDPGSISGAVMSGHRRATDPGQHGQEADRHGTALAKPTKSHSHGIPSPVCDAIPVTAAADGNAAASRILGERFEPLCVAFDLAPCGPHSRAADLRSRRRGLVAIP